MKRFATTWLLLALPLGAQVTVGDIAATGFSGTQFGIVGSSGGVTGFTTSGFQGTGLGWAQTILWDRANTDQFLVGGFGFIGRLTINAPGSASYQLLTNNVGIVVQMSWHETGLVVFVDAGTSQVRYLDPGSGAVFDLTTGAQPWGADASAGAWDPISGDVIVGGNGTIHRVNIATTAVTPVATGLGGFVSGIAFDPATGEIVATVLTANRFVRIASNGVVSDITPPFALPGPNALDVGPDGNFVVGGGTGQIHRVPRAGGAPVFLTNNTSPNGAVNGLAVVGGGGFGVPFGSACNGVNGPVALTTSGPYLVGSTLVTTSTNHASTSLGVLVLGLSRTIHGSGAPLPLLLDPIFATSQCWLNVSDDVLLAGVSSASTPSTLTISLAMGAAVAGLTFHAQHVGFEAVPGGLSWSNGVTIRVP